VVFADIRGFTELFKLHDKEQIAMILGDWFIVAYEDKVRKYDGLVDKFLGDGMLILFDNVKNAFYACCALLGLAKEIDEHLNQTPPTRWLGQEFSIGIGMEFGEVVEGKIPIGEQEHVLRIGDCINIASRLGEIAKPSEILIGNDARDRLKGIIVDDIFKKIRRERRKSGEYDCWSVPREAVLGNQ
jgi:adenylate cyclase